MNAAPDTTANRHTVTKLLHRWKGGVANALDALMPIVYSELRRMARRQMARERSDHTLQHTALVHEAYLSLVEMNVGWNDRSHFFAVAARAMRRILVDHARSRKRDKRGGDLVRVELEQEPEVLVASSSLDLEVLDDALERLRAIDPRKSEILEMRYFGGLTQQELAEVLGVSLATINRDLSAAKEWLRGDLGL